MIVPEPITHNTEFMQIGGKKRPVKKGKKTTKGKKATKGKKSTKGKKNTRRRR